MLNKNRTAKKRAFTLVEIMVTMAILVVMMSFLFQYVIGAQRIFTSSNRQAVLFDDAQIVLGLMENDLQNMVVSNEPGREIPMFYEKGTFSSKTYHILMMVTSGESTKLEIRKKRRLSDIIWSSIAIAKRTKSCTVSPSTTRRLWMRRI